jgi:FKBP-type peptidyl-prolyl cis-trans isomerase
VRTTDVPQIAPPADVAQPPGDAVRTFREKSTFSIASRIVSAGTGLIHPGPYDAVTVNYVLWTSDGKTVDASSARGTPSRWTIDQLVEGLRLGLPLMVAGETRRFWIPAEMAYEWATDTIVFDLTLLRVDAMPDAPTAADLHTPPADAVHMPSGVAYKVLTPSSATERPKPMSTVTIHYTGWAGRELFDNSIVRGEPLVVAVDTVIPGLSEALQRMVIGEKTRYWIPAALAYRPPGPPSASLLIDVDLIAIQHADAGAPGTIEIQTNSPNAAYVLVGPDGTPLPLEGPRTVSSAAPGQYRVEPTRLRSYACGVLATPDDLRLAPFGTMIITITYRPIVH